MSATSQIQLERVIRFQRRLTYTVASPCAVSQPLAATAAAAEATVEPNSIGTLQRIIYIYIYIYIYWMLADECYKPKSNDASSVAVSFFASQSRVRVTS